MHSDTESAQLTYVALAGEAPCGKHKQMSAFNFELQLYV